MAPKGSWEDLLNARREFYNREQEADLIRRAQAGDSAAEQDLLLSNIRFVYSKVRWYLNPGHPGFWDMFVDAMEGFTAAIRRFDFSREVGLRSYAILWIRSRCNSWLELNCEGPVHVPQDKRTRYKKLRRELEGMPFPSAGLAEEVAELECIVSPGTYSSSLDTLEADFGSMYMPRVDPDADESLNNHEIKMLVAKALSSAGLSQRYKNVLAMLYGLNGERQRTFLEVATHLGVSKNRVSQIQGDALAKLRKYFAKNNQLARTGREVLDVC